MNEQELLKIGFSDTSWTDDGNTFTEHTLTDGPVTIEISGLSLVEICQNHTYIEVPNCKTTDDLKTLLHLLGIRGNESKKNT